jgi:hypothetical protein
LVPIYILVFWYGFRLICILWPVEATVGLFATVLVVLFVIGFLVCAKQKLGKNTDKRIAFLMLILLKSGYLKIAVKISDYQ